MTAVRNNSQRRVVRVAGSMSAAVVLVCGIGCSKSPLEMVPVSGRITMDGGPLPVAVQEDTLESSVPIQPGTQSIEVIVQVTWEIQ